MLLVKVLQDTNNTNISHKSINFQIVYIAVLGIQGELMLLISYIIILPSTICIGLLAHVKDVITNVLSQMIYELDLVCY